MQRAFIKAGVNCDVWGLGHDNFDIVPSYETYDAIINLENYDTGWMPNLAHVTKPLKFLWAIDSHVRGYEYYHNVFIEGKYNYILQSTKQFCDKNSLWFPNCFDDECIKPINKNKIHLVGFCGNFVNRKPFFDYFNQQIPLKLDIDVRGINMINAINSYSIQLNKNISIDVNYRNFETMGCKTALLTDFNEQYAELGFKHNENCFIYKTVEEAIFLVNQLKNNTDLILNVAEAGYNLAISKHTFFKRANSLIKFINSL
jgi:hypothetical protein